MTSRAIWFLIVVVVLANGSATCLYSGPGPTADSAGPIAAPGNPVLQFVADALTWPTPTRGSVDIRNVVLPKGLGFGLIVLLAAAFFRKREEGTNKETASDAPAPPTCANGCCETGPSRWLRFAAIITAAVALISAIVNQSWLLSYGWLILFCAGGAWAYLIARTFDSTTVRPAFAGLLTIGTLAMVLTVWHRHERGLANFTWPIGPITTTAALAAAWAAVAFALLLGSLIALRRDRSRQNAATAILSLFVLALSLYVLIETGRRAPVLGFCAAAFLTAAYLLRFHIRRRIVTAIITATCILGIAAAAIYVQSQSRSDEKLTSGPLAVRFAYWKASAGFIADHPLLGTGPGTFIVDATNAFALRRAYEPHVYHGNVDPSAHNEWIQAAVELGLPGAILYAAIPIGVILLTLRRTLGRSPTTDKKPAAFDATIIVAAIAGITAIFVTECASITLRTPIVPIWYWTFIGLLIAATTQPRPTPATQPHNRGKYIIHILVVITCFVVSAREIDRACSYGLRGYGAADSEPYLDTMDLVRLQADQTVFDLYDNAALAANRASGTNTGSYIDPAVKLWKGVYDLIPGWVNVPAEYAEMLTLDGNNTEAKRVIEDAFEKYNPFDISANLLYAHSLTENPVEQISCVRRTMRSGSLGYSAKYVLTPALEDPAARQALEADAAKARIITAEAPSKSARDATVEALRLSALMYEQSGDLNAAVADQQLIANFYKKLADDNHRYRRKADAEIDAWMTLARLQYAASPANYKQALASILQAERFGALSVQHENVANPHPEDGFVGGEVLPMELPERLYDLWRFSAFLHIVAGQDKYLDLRILSSLPPNMRTQEYLNRELAKMATQAYKDLSTIPAEQRPPHYNVLPEMARRFGGAQ